MSRLNFISSPRMEKGRKHHRRAFLASLLFHGLALGSAFALALAYRSYLPIKSGSAPGAPSLLLEKMIVVSTPSQPPPPQPPKPTITPAASTPVAAATAPLREPKSEPIPPKATVPVLAIQPSKPMPVIEPPMPKTEVSIHSAISHTKIAATQSHSKPTTAPSVSSYAPGPNVLPHPPYPTEAHDRGQTGTVVMNVYFDVKGDVAQAEVAQSSGVPVLDSETRSFIRTHWHSSAYAGQSINVPVQYKLENL